jgi:hypothetical protein
VSLALVGGLEGCSFGYALPYDGCTTMPRNTPNRLCTAEGGAFTKEQEIIAKQERAEALKECEILKIDGRNKAFYRDHNNLYCKY